MIDFIVLGLPRSGTTWLANWLTTDTTVCLHDPFAHWLPSQLESQRNGKRLGISCTGAYLLQWLDTQECPVAIITRDAGERDASTDAIGYPRSDAGMQAALDRADGRRWSFTDLWNEDKARELWAFLLPATPFDAQRYRLLCEMQIQPHLGKWTPDLSIAEQLAGSQHMNKEVL